MSIHDLRNGYDANFLGEGTSLPIPEVGLEHYNDVVTGDDLRKGYIVDYIHYSVVMSRSNRQAFFSAANLDQKAFRKVKGRRWFIDERIGSANQIGPAAYASNPWDRGHLTRRTAVTWGSYYEAKAASNDSCSYANASLQHANFNQDEWRVPEEIVRKFDRDKNDRISVFTGPLLTDYDRWYSRPGMHENARIPSAFWKVIAYIGKASGKLESQAYLMYQDALFIADKRGRAKIVPENYQVTITEIERLTGLHFPEPLYDSNPLLFFTDEEAGDGRTNIGPEAFAAPRNMADPTAADGVVFERANLRDTPGLEKRRTDIEAPIFDEIVLNGGVYVGLDR